jgi:hypothetical protein
MASSRASLAPAPHRDGPSDRPHQQVRAPRALLLHASAFAVALAFCGPGAARADAEPLQASPAATLDGEPIARQPWWNAGFQSTYVLQRKGGFDAAYTGPHSLLTAPETGYTLTATLYLGIRLWSGAEPANGLSDAHRAYLAAGGLGFFIGDWRVDYRPEQILEAYYSFNAFHGFWFTLDAHHIANPAYNAARGPVNVAGVRAHVEY